MENILVFEMLCKERSFIRTFGEVFISINYYPFKEKATVWTISDFQNKTTRLRIIPNVPVTI